MKAALRIEKEQESQLIKTKTQLTRNDNDRGINGGNPEELRTRTSRLKLKPAKYHSEQSATVDLWPQGRPHNDAKAD